MGRRYSSGVPFCRVPERFDEENPNLNFVGRRSLDFWVNSARLARGVLQIHPFSGIVARRLNMRFMAPAASFLDLVFLVNGSYFAVFPFPGFGVPVPSGRSAAIGEV
eukprot:scaffold187_cov329-Pavlova_lutheri.AAC.3